MSKLNQSLTLTSLTAIAVGSCIGSGIFVTPQQVAEAVPNASLFLMVWALGSLVALTGSLTFTELGGMFPKSGGVYVYLREAYGDLVGFLFGWVTLLVVNTGALAGLCTAFAGYLGIFLPDLTGGAKTAVAAATMVGLTGFNMIGVKTSGVLARIFTTLKLLAIAGIVIASFLFFDAEKVQVDFSLAENMPTDLGSAMLIGLVGVFFSVGGWHHASYVAGEAKNARSTVPKAMFLGTLIVMVMYLLVNLAYLLLLPMADIATTQTVASDAIATIVPWGGKLVAVAIALSIFGTISIYTMSAPRIYFAMAEDGIFFKQLAWVHPRWRTPVVAMLFQVGWALLVLLFFAGSFNHIITFVTSMDIAFMGLAGAAVFVLRKSRRDDKDKSVRPIRAWGYPVVPFIFVALSAAFAVNTLLEKPEQVVPGVALLVAGVVAFYWFRKNGE